MFSIAKLREYLSVPRGRIVRNVGNNLQCRNRIIFISAESGIHLVCGVRKVFGNVQRIFIKVESGYY
jgi:hypothetical protein